MQALSQLSYGPDVCNILYFKAKLKLSPRPVACLGGSADAGREDSKKPAARFKNPSNLLLGARLRASAARLELAPALPAQGTAATAA